MEGSPTAVLKTLAYADIFDYPLTKEEIRQWLIEDKGKIEKTLQGLIKKGKVGQKDSYFFFKGRKKLVAERKKREEWAREKWRIAQKTAKKLEPLPLIKLIGVTGALAMNNARQEDDIDLLVISSANTLWLTRLLIFLFCPILGIKRRKPGEKRVKNKICFNLFLDESRLKVGPPSLFLAHEICQVRPLVNKEKTYERFLEKNRWVKDFLPNVEKLPRRLKQRRPSRSCFLAFFNQIAFWIQYQYMKSKMTVERISLYQAFFHPQDLPDKILSHYLDKIGEVTL